MDRSVQENYKYWLALHHAPNLTCSKARLLLDSHEQIETIFNLDNKALAQFGLTEQGVANLLSPDSDNIKNDVEWLQHPDHYLITYHDQDYPCLLREINDPPLILFAMGQREVIDSIQFAIVGSRNPTESGRRLTLDFSSQLAGMGLTITSGLALGIDYSSHLGALHADGKTIAVLGNGLETIYPSRHKDIAQQISEQGLLLSEYSPETKPLPHHFPRRNRIISGMSTGVLVIEAAKKSGSLITAKFALDQGREVFAIPGSIHNPLSKGCHSLIKQGAKLVESVEDIIEELGPIITAANVPKVVAETIMPDASLDAEYELLLDKMGFEPVTVNELVNWTGLTTDVVSSMLLILELNGFVEPHHGGRYIRVN